MKKLTVSQCPTSQYCAGYNVAVDKANDGLAELRKLKDELEGRVSGYEMVLAAHLAENVALKEQLEQWKCNSRENKLIAEQLAEPYKREIAQQAEALESVLGIANQLADFGAVHMPYSKRVELQNKLLAIQPNPDILRERDARLVERIAKFCEEEELYILAYQIRKG